MKVKTHIFLTALCLLLAACAEKEVSFTYSPQEPRAGESIRFSNTTSEGETWEWNFGDGTTATSKNPSKVYKRPGSYTVVLVVDKKQSRRASATITVVDTIPQITLADDSLVFFMHPVKLRMNAYNPYNYTKIYQWQLNENVELVGGSLTSEYITVLFNKQHSCEQSVSCKVTIGDASYTCEKSFYVHDTVAPQIIMSRKDNVLMLQRTFINGIEEPRIVQLGWSANPETSTIYSMAVDGNSLFLFSADPTQDAALRVYELASGDFSKVVYNAMAGEGQGFYNGIFHSGMLYWTDATGGMMYHVPSNVRDRAFTAGTSSAQYWGDICHVGYSLTPGSVVSGLAAYNDYFLMGYGQGIYRFTAANRGTTTPPEAGAILTDITVEHFALDPIAKKVYYLTSEGLYICNFNGDNRRLVCSSANGQALCVDNTTGRIYWTQDNGVFCLPLIQSANNATTDIPTQFNTHSDVEAIVSDPTPRHGKL